MAPPPPPPPPPPPLPDELGFDAVLDGMSNGTPESAGLPSFVAESNGLAATNQNAVVKAPETKSWEKPLTIPEIRKSSNNWSLASDAGLLVYLQEFSQKMMTKTSDLEKRMDSLVHDAKSADSRVHNTFNDFLMLANTQFIENRVYDDSEDVDGGSSGEKDKKEAQTKSREQREAEVIPRVIQALTLGINVLDTGFEHLDANAGNSDSDDEDPTYKAVDPILEAKDMYAHRSLPYIIGTPAFMQDDDVGLLELSEEEVDDESSQEDTLSDTDKSELSESDYTDTETESDFTGGPHRQVADTTATSTIKTGSDDSDTGLFDEDEAQQPAAAQPMNFQDELAAKLGGPGAGMGRAAAEPGESTDDSSRNRTISETSKTSESSKKATRRKKLPLDREKKSKKKSSPSKSEDDNLFGEQVDQEAEDSPFSKKGLFSSSGGGLFDDEREDEGGLFDEKPSGGRRREEHPDHVYEDIVAHPEEVRHVKKAPPGGVPMFGAGGAQQDELFGGSTKQVQDGEKRQKDKSGGLFDGQDEDALFADSAKSQPKTAAKPKPKKQVDLFGEDDDSDLFGESKPQQPPPKKKIPAGAVNVLGGQTEPPPLDDDDDEDMYVNNLVSAPSGGRGKHAPLSGSLFDTVDEDLFGTPPPRPAEKSAAQNDNDKLFADDNEDDLFAAPPPLPKDESKAAAKKNQGLFDDIEETGEDDLFATSSKPKETSKKKPPGGVALFEGADIFGSPPKAEPEPIQKKSEMSAQAKANRAQNTLSLFHDDADKDEELFAPAPTPPPKKEQLEPTSKEEQMNRRRTKSKSIFDDEAILFGLKNEENPGVDLFGSDTPISKNETEKDNKTPTSSPRKRASSASKGLFGDEDEEDDLFSSTASKYATAPRPRSTGVKAALMKERKKKKAAAAAAAAAPSAGGLFGDEEEDDLFGETKDKGKKGVEKKKEDKVKEEKEKEEGGKKEKMTAPPPAITISEDPLGGSQAAAHEDTPPPPPKQDPPLLPPIKKPPAGAVSMFGGIDPTSIAKNRTKSQIEDDLAFDSKPKSVPKPAPKPQTPQSPSDSTAPLFDSTPPSDLKTAPKSSSLFSSSPSPPSSPLFGSSPPTRSKSAPKPSKNPSSSAGSAPLFGSSPPDSDSTLFGSSTPTRSKSAPKPAKKSSSTKNAPLVGSSPPRDSDSPLFGSSPPTSSKPAPKPSPKPSSSSKSAPLFGSSPPSSSLFGSSPPPSPRQDSPGQDSPDYAVVTPRIRSVQAPKGKSSAVSKLKANMNIDPTALKPGAAPPSRGGEASTVGFDQPAVAKTLLNPTKTRARISAKRRPPSRRSLHAAAAAASASNGDLWSGGTGEKDEGFETFTRNLADDDNDEADLGAVGGPVHHAAPLPAKKPASHAHDSHRVPPPALKPKKKVVPSDSIFDDDLFSDTSNTTLDITTSSKTSHKEERPFSIEGESQLFAPKPTAAKTAPSRTARKDENQFAKTQRKADLDASVDDIFAAPPVLGQSSKQGSEEIDPTYEDIFAAPATGGKNKRSTLTDLAIDEDLFGDSKSSIDTSGVGVDEDLFAAPPPPTTTTKTKKKKSVKKAPVLEDDDLFGEKPKKTKTKAAKATDSDLFGDSDIFADLPAAKPKEKKKKKLTPDDSIFKDVQGDGIFSDPPASTKPKKTKAKKKAAKEASDSIFDTEGPSIFDDPLNAMNN